MNFSSFIYILRKKKIYPYKKIIDIIINDKKQKE